MPRPKRVVVPGEPHHITQRGNNRRSLFLNDSCYLTYLGMLKERFEGWKIALIGYCLMPNHVHLVVKPPGKEALARAMAELSRSYSGYVGRRLQNTGHLWERRYYSAPMEPDHLWRCLRYVERNPVRAGLVDEAWNYPWSSAARHSGAGAWHRCQAPLSEVTPDGCWDTEVWRKYISDLDQLQDISQIRSSTSKGVPWGSESYISALAKRFHRPLIGWSPPPDQDRSTDSLSY